MLQLHSSHIFICINPAMNMQEKPYSHNSDGLWLTYLSFHGSNLWRRKGDLLHINVHPRHNELPSADTCSSNPKCDIPGPTLTVGLPNTQKWTDWSPEWHSDVAAVYKVSISKTPLFRLPKFTLTNLLNFHPLRSWRFLSFASMWKKSKPSHPS